MVDFVLTKKTVKELTRLNEAKWRRRDGLFMAEGTKCVAELLKAGLKCRYMFAAKEWFDENDISQYRVVQHECVKGDTLRQLTNLGTLPQVIAYFELPEQPEIPDITYMKDNIVLALDRIQDPGNLGTILRTCDWMGVRYVVASNDTVDAYNPKTVQASMGAVATVSVIYTDLDSFLRKVGSVPVLGTYLDGEDIYRTSFGKGCVLLMGNEGSGISEALEPYVGKRLNIPLIGPGPHAAESLNVSTATAIALSQIVSQSRQ